MSHPKNKDRDLGISQKKIMQINVLEPKVVQFAIQSLIKQKKERSCLHQISDNTTVVAYKNRMGKLDQNYYYKPNNKADLDLLSIQED